MSAALALAPVRPASAQFVGAGAFLRHDPNARAAALAGASLAVMDDPGALMQNPAALTLMRKPGVEATRVTLYEQTALDVVSFALPTRWGTFAAGYLRQSSGGFERLTGPNDVPTTFSIEQSATMGGWAYSPRLPWDSREEGARRMLSVGAAAKSVRESIADSRAAGTGVDVGLLIRPTADWSLGLRVQNLIAPKPAFGSASLAYPRALDVSPAWSRSSGDWRLTLAARLSRVDQESTAASGGAELQYGRHAALRIGARDVGPSTGFGLAFGNTRVDYAALLHELGLSHSITLVQRFGQTREELEETIRRGISRLSRGEGARLARAYLQKAEREMQEDKVSEARRNIEAASLLDPGNEEIAAKLRQADALWAEALQRQTVERLAQAASQQHEQGNLLAARQYWRAVLDLDDSNQRARRELARLDAALSSEERARAESLRQAQQANDIALALAGAATFLARGQIRSARTEAEKVRKRWPDNPQIRDFMARSGEQLKAFVDSRKAEADKLLAARDGAGALASLEAALREDPDNAELKQKAEAVRSELRGRVSSGDRKKAEQLYYRAVEQYLKGSYDTAGKFVEELLTLDPSSEPGRALKEKVDAARRYSR